MQLDTKQQVLVAVYIEYQKDLPDMNRALPELNLDMQVLRTALGKLENEGYITGFWGETKSPGSRERFQPKSFRLVTMTRDGIEYVETKLGIEKTMTGQEKVEKAKKTFIEQGLDVLTDYAAKVTAEMLKL